ncbi:MAG: HlyD family efflux transporter periplasmic adaptor subunit [Pseudomonadota bacterium]
MLISAGIVGVAVLTSASIFATGPDAAPAAHVEKAWPVSVTQAEMTSIAPNVSVYGKLEANRLANLRSDIVARIQEVSVNEGEWVETGEVLVRLEAREFELKVLEREAQLRQHEAELASAKSQLVLMQESHEHYQSRHQVAKAKLTRHQGLMQKRLISKSLLDEVIAATNQAAIEYRQHKQDLINLPGQIAVHEANLAQAQALLEQARMDLEKTAITAPFSGPVLEVLAAPGDYSNLSTPLVQLADASSFEVRVQIPQTQARQFHQNLDSPGASAIIATDDYGQSLRLRRLASQVRAGQTGLDAFFVFDHLPRSQALGQVLNLNIELPSQQNLIALPVQSIYENKRIYAVRDNRLVGVDIERVGERESADAGYQILVRSDQVMQGEQIITTQLPRAITGLLVEVSNQGLGVNAGS